MSSKIPKAISGLAPILTLLFSLLMLSLVAWAYSHAYLIFHDYTLLSALLASTLVLIIAGLIGVCGQRKNSSTTACVFQIFVMLFCCVFLGLGISASRLPSVIFEGTCSQSENSNIELAHRAYEISSASFCTPICPCFLDDTKMMSDSEYSLQQKLTLKTLKTTSKHGAKNYQECQISNNYNHSYGKTFQVLSKAEKSLSCSGWCGEKPLLLYKFSDSSRGKPQQTCYVAISQHLQMLSLFITVGSITIFIFLLMVCSANILICMQPERRALPLRKRFGELDEDPSLYRNIS